ncbi:MAG TPA: flagellar hook-associated protein FlgL [Candidatus Acidoferrum sp.]|nr:flagellar hook-associated protein FlgL [Candidatus Acidoferrum sp.]
MRIPTFQQYQAPVAMMQQQNAILQKTQMQLSSGLRILTPSDDPTGSARVLNLNANLSLIDQYGSNGTVAKNSLGQQDTTLSSVNDSLQRIRQLVVQGMSPTNDDGARANIALELDQNLQQLMGLANTRDANGEYLFSGSNSTTIPFVDQGGTVTYQGDQTSRAVQVGDGTQVTTRDAGDKVFMQIPSGDGIIDVRAGGANTGTLVVGQFSGGQQFVPGNYTVTFNTGSGGQMNYTVTDGATPPNTVGTGTYQAGGNITFGGVQMTLSGNPADGDVVTVQPSQPQSVFAVVKSLITSLRTPSNGNSTSIQNRMAQGLAGLDQTLTAVNNQRAVVGARLNTLDSMDNINANFKDQLTTLKSNTEDLDYADAITKFNQQLTSLQAAQQTYKKTTSLSLFNYL